MVSKPNPRNRRKNYLNTEEINANYKIKQQKKYYIPSVVNELNKHDSVGQSPQHGHVTNIVKCPVT